MYLEIPGDTLLWFEMHAAAAMLVLLGIWIVIPKMPVARGMLLIMLFGLCLAAFRPPEYNSDTGNYFSYVQWLSFFDIRQALFLTKMEPVHSILAALLRDFRIWLIFETAIQAYGVYICYKAKDNDQAFIVLCAFLLTLSTSSLRFASSLPYFLYFVYLKRSTIWSSAKMTAILSCFHVSMLLSGMISLRRVIAPVAVICFCVLVLYESSLLGYRVEEDLSENSFGLKTLSTVMGVAIYLFARGWKKVSTYHVLYIIGIGLLFAVTVLVLPTFNRFLIMAALAFLANEWTDLRGKGENDVIDRLFLLVLCSLILIPYMIIVPERYYTGTW